MHVERLIFQVLPWVYVKDFIQADAEVWTPWLQRQPGYVTKTHRILPGGQVEFLIHWKSKADREAAKHQPDIQAVEGLMRLRSPGNYRLIASL
jgi:uncharacterized protein (TIGR03792 family)